MKKLRKFGSAAHVSRSGLIIAQIEPGNLPEVGAEVLTDRAEKIGNVYDIIGPTKTPFALIKPRKNSLKKFAGNLANKNLFVVIPHAGSRKGKGSRKKGSRKRD
jgi:rRNA processing protein Gar1